MKPSSCLLNFIKELQIIIPNIYYYKVPLLITVFYSKFAIHYFLLYFLLHLLLLYVYSTFIYFYYFRKCSQRGKYRIKSIVKYATNGSFTDVVVLTERRKRPVGLYVSHLPEGPTSFFKLTNVKLAQEMKCSAAVTTHKPEVVLNNFDTRLGRRVARQLLALFPIVRPVILLLIHCCQFLRLSLIFMLCGGANNIVVAIHRYNYIIMTSNIFQ